MTLTINPTSVLINKPIPKKPEKSLLDGSVIKQHLVNPKLSSSLLQVYFTGKVEKPQTIYSTASVAEKQQIEAYAKEYVDFLKKTKTNFQAAQEIIKVAKAKGYKPLNPDVKLQPGDKVYFERSDKAIVMATIGKNPITSGVKIVGSHIDSPHFVLKAKPIQEREGYCVFKTMPHGLGSKRYQWVNRFLTLEGKIETAKGTVAISTPKDKAFLIPDLAPHIDGDANISKEFKAEEMTPIVALNGDMDGTISEYVEKILKEQYNITKEDIINGDLCLVPTDDPKTIGFDESLLGAYGHDDKSSAFASLKAEVDQQGVPEHTTIAAFFGNEEIGSYNNYGARSAFFKDSVADLIENQKGSFNENDLRRTFKKSLALSGDVSTAVDPIKPGHEEKTNACRLGNGVIMKLQGWRNSSAEATASITSIFKRDDVKWQPFAYHQDMGGGSTIGMLMATDLNIDVVDVGVPVLSMHAPIEVADKGDLFHLYKGMSSFLNNDKIREVDY